MGEDEARDGRPRMSGPGQGSSCGDDRERGPGKSASGPGTPAANPEAPPPDAVVAMAQRWPFGPMFFLGQLGAFVRDKCPAPDEGLPVVEIRIADGDVLDLCHVIGVAPTWVALAVNELDAETGATRMRTELVPYDRIVGVTVRTSRDGEPHIGFTHGHQPETLAGQVRAPATPEEALRAAAGPMMRKGAPPDPGERS